MGERDGGWLVAHEPSAVLDFGNKSLSTGLAQIAMA